MNDSRILIVDDDIRTRGELRDILEEQNDQWKVVDQGFDGLVETLVRVRPDIVILDLVDKRRDGHGNAAGSASFAQIRATWFCPVIVYSGYPARKDFEHPLATFVQKGSDAHLEVRDRLVEFIPVATVIRAVHEDFDARIREALRDSVHAQSEQIADGDHESFDELLLRAVRRLVVARADLATGDQSALQPWERFAIPPLGDHLLTADLLRADCEPWTDPDAFRLVLTPSCDLVGDADRPPKAERILVARCEPLGKLGKMEFQPGKPLSQRQRSVVGSILAEGMDGLRVPIPQFRGHVPLMAANLKRLDLVEWRDVDCGQNGDGAAAESAPRFVRAASTDSPFREMVVWAHLRVTGRPGLPDTDIERWMDDISYHLKAAPASPP